MTTTETSGPLAQVEAVRRLHSYRAFDVPEAHMTSMVCAEDRQIWPCATIQALDAARCELCQGEGFVIEPRMQCDGGEHECGEGCAAPEQVRCRCTPPPIEPARPPAYDPAEEPF